jgi:hypothetical protein
MLQATSQYTGRQDLDVNISGFLRHLRSENPSERTQRTCLESVNFVARFLIDALPTPSIPDRRERRNHRLRSVTARRWAQARTCP